MKRQAWMTAALLAVCGCASSSSSSKGSTGAAVASTGLSEATGNVMVEAYGKTRYVALEGNTLKGPQVNVEVQGGTAKGEAYGAPVDLALAQGTVQGKVGEEPIRLQLQPTKGGLRADGLYRGRESSFSFSPNTLSGNVATCRYDLKRSNRSNAYNSAGTGGSGLGTDYKGERDCEGKPSTDVKVTLPSGFERLAPAQQATILGLMLERAME
ncbi:hypothetical protein FGE12_12045 [Aggregicoccus sp. 17bor-14]|uniref:hypothetical protein n=1 Tax=Myxococcaceae TaxID=31 RepID=UPI00129D1A07|nr:MULTISPECIES: hypothetical protein [Myxococcaceae]MBF5043120.1 hypothetical protein [Simulacricoccus sp. 17bor-14]MRI88882.1 hypothetical protein [Aggregicoccus sp. 17bor-14]